MNHNGWPGQRDPELHRKEKRMAKRRITRIEPAAAKPKTIRVAAYCRVSTALDGQAASLVFQRTHYEEVISHHDGWELADIYYEEGVTGTKKDIRPELNRMLADCRKGKINLILTKSISRFARNTADCIGMVRELTGIGVHLVFEKEGIDTRQMDSEFLLTVLASLAEQESKSISGNVRWSVKKKFQNGTYKYSRAPYGYDLVNGTFVINQSEAPVIRWIYGRILEGKGTSWIAKELNRRDVPTKNEIEGRGKAKWHNRTISEMVENPVYIGDILMQKTFCDDQLRRHDNFGEEDQYYLEGHHEAIIDRETFELAGACLRQHGKECGNVRAEGAERHKDIHTNRSCFTGKLVCGQCGKTLQRVTQKTNGGKVYHWACSGHLRDVDSCSLKRIREESIQNAFVTMVRKLQYAPFLPDWYVQETEKQEEDLHRKRLEEIQKKSEQNTEKRHRLALLLSKGCVEPVFYKQEMAKLEAEAAVLKEEKNSPQGNSLSREFRRYVHGFKGEGFDPDGFEKHVEKVVVESRTRFTFELTCGLRLTEDLAEG